MTNVGSTFVWVGDDAEDEDGVTRHTSLIESRAAQKKTRTHTNDCVTHDSDSDEQSNNEVSDDDEALSDDDEINEEEDDTDSVEHVRNMARPILRTGLLEGGVYFCWNNLSKTSFSPILLLADIADRAKTVKCAPLMLVASVANEDHLYEKDPQFTNDAAVPALIFRVPGESFQRVENQDVIRWRLCLS